MEKYTLYCNEEQTRKAFELGAPIEVSHRIESVVNRKYFGDLSNFTFTIIPTAEQLIGWMEDNGINEITIQRTSPFNTWGMSIDFDGESPMETHDAYFSRKEATNAAIDVALKYLMSKKGE